MAQFYAQRPPRLKDVPRSVIGALASLPDTHHILLEFQISNLADIDLVVAHEKAIWVVEVKGSRGVVRGGVSDPQWQVAGERPIQNPIRQVRRYVDALR